MRWGRRQCGSYSCAHGRRRLYGLINARKDVAAALLANASPPPAAPPDVVRAMPASIDFGSFQTSAALELSLTALGTESVVTLSNDSNVVTVAPVSINATARLGTYALTVNRLGLGGGVDLCAPDRHVDDGPLLCRPAHGDTAARRRIQQRQRRAPLRVAFRPGQQPAGCAAVLVVRGATGYTWSTTGRPLASFQVGAGADLDGDNRICEHGEPCGALPVLGAGSGGGVSMLTLTGSRSDINFHVSLLTGISPRSAPSSTPSSAPPVPPGWSVSRWHSHWPPCNCRDGREGRNGRAGSLSAPPRYQNCQFPVTTTHTANTPLVTACAITAVHSLPVRM